MRCRAVIQALKSVAPDVCNRVIPCPPKNCLPCEAARTRVSITVCCAPITVSCEKVGPPFFYERRVDTHQADWYSFEV